MLQLVALLAMEPPAGHGYEAVRDAKAELLRAMRPLERVCGDLRGFWMFLAEYGLGWEQVGVGELAEFAAWRGARLTSGGVGGGGGAVVGADGQPDAERCGRLL